MNRALGFFLAPEPTLPPTRTPRKRVGRGRIASAAEPPQSAPVPRVPGHAGATTALDHADASVPVASPRVVSAATVSEPAARSFAGPALVPGDPLAGAALPPRGVVLPHREITGAAVVGRHGEAEPVAAAVALTLRRDTRAKTATVVVIGPPLPEGPRGGGAGRRLAARLAEHGIEAHVRGRLVWVRLDPAERDLAAVAWQVALVAAPVVFVVTAPRTAAIDAVLADQDLVVLVTPDPEGPLAIAATAGLGRLVLAKPLGRGLARELSRAGVRAAPTIRRLLEGGAR